MSYVHFDDTPTEKQINLVKWFSDFRDIPLPDDVLTSKKAWWKWLNKNVGRIDREDAKEALIDYGIRVDFDDLSSIIGAIKYGYIRRNTPIADQMAELLKRGCHPYLVQDQFLVDDDLLYETVRRVELSGYEIDWGSV